MPIPFLEDGYIYGVRSYRQLRYLKADAAGSPVVWPHPAYANRCAYIRNDKEIICVNLTEK